MLRRHLNILLSHSFFLFGARGVGKTKLIHEILPGSKTLFLDLLDPNDFDRLALEPALLERIIADLPSGTEWVAIDEIQKLPALLDIVHRNIESEHRKKFALTGTSARKLKRGNANLLAGRAFAYSLYPFTHLELGESFDIDSALRWGTLPMAVLSSSEEEKELYLRTYVQTYLREEIQIEQLIRKLEPFRKFLQVAAQSSGKIINHNKIASDIGVSDKTVKSYFQILEDTLIGFYLEPYHKSIRKRQGLTPKFYLFDCGVRRALLGLLRLDIHSSTYEYGNLFEHFIILELKRLCEYERNDFQFYYLRTKDDAEIDLIIERPGKRTIIAEIKSTNKVTQADTTSLGTFARAMSDVEAICISQDSRAQRFSSLRALPWRQAIQEIVFGD